MHPPATNPINADTSQLAVCSVLVVIFGVLIMALRLAQGEYLMAIGAVWAANGLTLIFHALYWGRHGLSPGYKAAVVVQAVLTILPLCFGKFGLALIFLMLGGELRFW
ncbi:hypothetical protein [Pseudomonas purpurea]|uniref:hypothetical protein n=1 Tax=Pseudomonas purpurea TaxID=3136737 RepID=UPI0032635469